MTLRAAGTGPNQLPPPTSEGSSQSRRLASGNIITRIDPSKVQEKLSAFFKDSPWSVTIVTLGQRQYYAWTLRDERSTAAKSSLAPLPQIYLTEFNSANPPFTIELTDKHLHPMLMIPMPQNTGWRLSLNKQNMELTSDRYLAPHDIKEPLFLSIPKKKMPWWEGELVIGMKKYQRTSIDWVDSTHLTLLDGVSAYTNVELFEVQKSKPEHKPVPITKPMPTPRPSPVQEIKPNLAQAAMLEKIKKLISLCPVFDTSGSMRMFTRERSIDVGTKYIAEVAKLVYIAIKQLKLSGFLDAATFFWSINFYVGQEIHTIELPLEAFAAKKSGADALALSGLGLLAMLDPEAGTIVNIEAVRCVVSGAFSEVESTRELYVGTDSNNTDPKSLFGQCGTVVSVSDTWGQMPVMPQTMAVTVANARREQNYFHPQINKKKAVTRALDEKLPFFVSTVLLEDTIDVPKEEPKSGKDVPLSKLREYEVFGRLQNLYSADMSLQIESLGEIRLLFDRKDLDKHVLKRAAALLTAWGIKGNEQVKERLWQIFVKKKGLSLDVRAYLAKCISMFITPARAEEILENITTNLEMGEEIDYAPIVALAGTTFYSKAIGYILDEEWDDDILNTFLFVQMTIFLDPFVTYDLPENLSEKELKTLAGIDWNAIVFQDIFETVTAYVIPALAPVAQELLSLMNTYAQRYLKPEWFQRKTIELNPVPDKLFWYRLQDGRSAAKEIQTLTKAARLEESWAELEAEDCSYLIENGVLQQKGTVVAGIYPYEEAARVMELDFKEIRMIRHHHVHPHFDTSLPIEISPLPSTADFHYWLNFTSNALTHNPNAQIEFIIESPFGLTTIRPKKKFIEMARAFAEGKGAFLGRFEMAVEDYKVFVLRTIGHLNIRRINHILEDYFEIEIERIDKKR